MNNQMAYMLIELKNTPREKILKGYPEKDENRMITL